jgi:hypothetical protein
MKTNLPIRLAVTTILAAIIAGCGIKPIHFDGKSATYTHHEADFAAAMIQAKDMCSLTGKSIKHESTACSRTLSCVSTFSCTGQ